MFIQKVFSKNLSQPIKKIGQNLTKAPAPKDAKTFDVIKGISKKGTFSIYSFKNAKNEIIQKEIIYTTPQNDRINIVRNYTGPKTDRTISSTKYLNDKKMNKNYRFIHCPVFRELL